MRRIVEESGDMVVVAEAADGAAAIRRALARHPDVAVLDLSMPGMDGLEVIGRLQCHYPRLPILILAMHDEEQFVVARWKPAPWATLPSGVRPTSC